MALLNAQYGVKKKIVDFGEGTLNQLLIFQIF